MFDRLVAIFKDPATPEIRQLARTAMAAFDAPPLVERALGLVLDGTLKTQDVRDVLMSFIRRKNTVGIAHAWVEKHFDEVANTSPIMPLVLARTPIAICNAERVRAVEAFLRPRLEKVGGAADLQEYVEVAMRCAALADKETAPTSAWLAAHVDRR
jgi:hypothetical protein